MNALVCSQYGSPEKLTFTDLEIPILKSKEVLIKVHSSALNFPDTLTIQGQDQYGLTLPFVPGREVSGVIEQVSSDITSLKVGDKVMAHMMTGALQEYAVAGENATFLIPDKMSFEEAAVFPVTYGTAFHALVNRAAVTLGETVVILGASGGVGLAALQIAKANDCKVIACVGSEDKMEFCYEQGADSVINYSKENLKIRIKELTNGQGADIILDMIGGDYSELAFRALGWEGRMMIIGFTSGFIGKLPLNLPLLKGASVMGVFWSSFCKKHPNRSKDNMDSLSELYSKGKLAPHIHQSFSFKEAKQLAVLSPSLRYRL